MSGSPSLDHAPFLVIWEMTQACYLARVHGRASARPFRSPRELTTAEGEDLIRQVRDMGTPIFVMTGGDPMKRPDLFHLHESEVFPSGFLPLLAGSLRRQTRSDIYRNSPLLVALRDFDRLEGKCHVCEFREICGGSRTRALAMTGHAFASDPGCS